MKMQKQKVIFTLISLLSSLIAAYQLNFMLLDLNNAIYYPKKVKVIQYISSLKTNLQSKISKTKSSC